MNDFMIMDVTYCAKEVVKVMNNVGEAEVKKVILWKVEGRLAIGANRSSKTFKRKTYSEIIMMKVRQDENNLIFIPYSGDNTSDIMTISVDQNELRTVSAMSFLKEFQNEVTRRNQPKSIQDLNFV